MAHPVNQGVFENASRSNNSPLNQRWDKRASRCAYSDRGAVRHGFVQTHRSRTRNPYCMRLPKDTSADLSRRRSSITRYCTSVPNSFGQQSMRATAVFNASLASGIIFRHNAQRTHGLRDCRAGIDDSVYSGINTSAHTERGFGHHSTAKSSLETEGVAHSCFFWRNALPRVSGVPPFNAGERRIMKTRIKVHALKTKPRVNDQGTNVGTNQYYWLFAWLFG